MCYFFLIYVNNPIDSVHLQHHWLQPLLKPMNRTLYVIVTFAAVTKTCFVFYVHVNSLIFFYADILGTDSANFGEDYSGIAVQHPLEELLPI